MEYKVVISSKGWSFTGKVEQLMKTVNELIALGWEPLGGVAFTDNYLSQAMVKRR